MRHKRHHTRLCREVGHRTALLRNLTRALILSEDKDGNKLDRIETTAAKAKTLRPFVENLITLGKKGKLHHRRMAFAALQDKEVVHRIFEELAPRFKDRQGGYTRVIRSRRREGDAAEMAFIELVERTAPVAPAQESAAG